MDGWTDRQMMSNAVVADWLLAAEATNKYDTKLVVHNLHRTIDACLTPSIRLICDVPQGI